MNTCCGLMFFREQVFNIRKRDVNCQTVYLIILPIQPCCIRILTEFIAFTGGSILPPRAHKFVIVPQGPRNTLRMPGFDPWLCGNKLKRLGPAVSLFPEPVEPHDFAAAL